jgi:DUF2946 family protein
MALNVAWPLLANANPVDPAAEICSASGLKHAAGGAPAAPEKGFHAWHCNLCPFGAERGAAIAPPVQPLLASAPAAAPGFAPGRAPQTPVSLYPAAPARGPPLPS